MSPFALSDIKDELKEIKQCLIESLKEELEKWDGYAVFNKHRPRLLFNSHAPGEYVIKSLYVKDNGRVMVDVLDEEQNEDTFFASDICVEDMIYLFEYLK